jgi:RNA-directed DNA polymerase
VYVPKADGRQRPIGVPVLEDKIVQKAAVAVLNQVYETEFLGFSYGFRPRRSPHDALAALDRAIFTEKVNYVLDADIRGFFDAISHEWTVKFVEHRIGDKRVIRLIQKWLKAGVLEDGTWTQPEEGTPQGCRSPRAIGHSVATTISNCLGLSRGLRASLSESVDVCDASRPAQQAATSECCS